MRIRSTASAYVVRRSSRGESPQADVRSPSSASSRTSSSRGLVGCRLQAAAHWVVARLVDIVLTGRCALLGYGVERALHLFAPEFAEYAAGARIGPVRPAAAREGRPEPQRGQEAGEKDQAGDDQLAPVRYNGRPARRRGLRECSTTTCAGGRMTYSITPPPAKQVYSWLRTTLLGQESAARAPGWATASSRSAPATVGADRAYNNRTTTTRIRTIQIRAAVQSTSQARRGETQKLPLLMTGDRGRLRVLDAPRCTCRCSRYRLPFVPDVCSERPG